MQASSTIKQYRKNMNMTQQELAEKIGVSSVAVSQWEKGRQKPRAVALIRMAEVFGCSPKALIEDDKKAG